jgi:hypothetical protein
MNYTVKVRAVASIGWVGKNGNRVTLSNQVSRNNSVVQT